MLSFLHTSPVHIETFDDLLQQWKPTLPVRHYVEESLLQWAKEAGRVTPRMERQVERAVTSAVNDGATVLLCTCSTIGSLAESFDGRSGCAVLRVDRPMAQKAVATASRIALVATLRNTLPSTRDLLTEEAGKAQKEIRLVEGVCEVAWAKFEAGDREGYLREIAETVREVAGDVEAVVLAQASMRGVERYCETVSIPIYSSPEIGLREAIRRYESHSMPDITD